MMPAPAGNPRRSALSEEPQVKVSKPKGSESVVVRPYPKVIFFWPTWITSLVAAIVMQTAGESVPVHLGTVWMCVFAFNLIVIAFDFNEVVSVMVLALLGVLIFAGLYFDFLGPIGDFFAKLKLRMSAGYYWTMFGLFTLIYFFVFLKTRFDYWEFRYNEVIHRRGVFADIKRYSTEDLRWFKEIPDVLERIMAGSGRMILTTPREPHPIVIEHVIGINRIDEKVADILGVKRVTMD
jgi:hypothetical protein